ncbi:hypothetical protein [Mycobacterium sp.]|uniref:hypothetical protein n=1 Tax=Mycobacterium sp. TaxID=1785 RepID=UPI002633FEC1|nr:hypothetical protein [Mycobacterium sp.]
MAARLDVDARLGEGRVAVEHTQTYVQACHTLGYQHPDLTAHPAQIREWYASEDGLDLGALDRDCAELRAAGVVVAEALRMQRTQVAELAAAWTGPGGAAAVQLLQRHCDTADGVVAELRASAQRCESLRDNLWHLVDSKVATAIAVDDRTRAQRPAWLAAAAAVATGGLRSAEEVVRQQLIPYVDNDIRNDWLTAMRSTSDGVQTSYAMVIDRAAAAPAARFEFPGDLGTSLVPMHLAPPLSAAPVPPVDDPAPTVTAAAPAPIASTPAPLASAPAVDWGTALGDASAVPAGGVGDLGGGLGGAGLGGGGLGGGGGLLGLAGRIVDAMGGLLGSASDGSDGTDPFGEGNAFDENPFHAGDPVDTMDTGDVTDDEGAPETAESEEADPARPVDEAGPADPDVPDPQAQPVETPPPADVSAPTPAEPTPPAAPAAEPAPPLPAEGSTPCEIAADQVPQAGR